MTSRRKPSGGDSAGRDGGQSIPTAPAQQTGLALPPADAVTAVRIVGSKLPEIPLPPEKRIFVLGSDDHPDIDVHVSSKLVGDPSVEEHVSRVHLQIQRKGSRLWLHDQGSTNGTFIKNRRERDGSIAAGDTFRVGNVTLLALDDQMRLLRPTLRWALGFDAHAYVDATLGMVTSGEPLLLIGPPACEQRFLAEQIHATSARRGLGFVAITTPLPERDRFDDFAAASNGTVYADLDELRRVPAWFVALLFSGTYQVRPIIAARTPETARKHLGDVNMPHLRVITIPSVKERRGDVPGILNSLFRQSPLNSDREVSELGAERVARLKAFDWPENFDDLRRNAPKILAYINAGFNETAAARALGKTRQSLGESLRRIGL